MTDNLEKMLAGGRDDAMLRFGLGSAYFNEKRYEDAIRHLQACLKHDEGYTAAYKLLGKAFFQQDQLQEAIEVLEKGLPIATGGGDKQSQKEIEVFLNKARSRSNT
ncbi:MAG: tetratricopeptide repeat protein [Pseudomonadales bacterium]|nr:tetratricopeptide repeat protein [Pseudomonadales bacterium]